MIICSMKEIAERLDKSLNMWGVKSAFNLISVDKDKWIKRFSSGHERSPIYICSGAYLIPPK